MDLNFFIKKKKKIGVALGGGAALGMAHIGVLKAMDEARIPISFITGTSVGSLIGVLYADGISPQSMEKIASTITWSAIAKPSISGLGLLSSEPMEDFINKYLISKKIEDLKIPFAAVAVDASEGSEIIFDSGFISTGIRASCSVPGIFRPIEQNGLILIDGGVMNNIPVTTARKLGADYVIAVNLLHEYNTWKPKTTAELILKSFLLAQYSGSKHELETADLLINVNTKNISPVDIKRAKKLVKSGYEEAKLILANNKIPY